MIKRGRKTNVGLEGAGRIPKNDFMRILNPNAAGIDLGSGEHWVAVPDDRDEQPVRKFDCFTADLHAMANWLEKCGIQTVAMESTGVYWIPVFQILETRGIEVKLVNAGHIKNVPGRKTDILDCQWIQQLHSCGLLSGSFRPEDQICVLRSYWRHRDNLSSSAATEVQHMQKALIQMNLHLHKVISDITGVTGMRIIKSIVAGERDPMILAQMKDHRIKNSADTITKSLQGDYRQEHLFALKQAVEIYDTYSEKIKACDDEIEQCLAQFEDKADTNDAATAKMRTRKAKRHHPEFDLHRHLCRITGNDYTQIPGLDVLHVQTIISEAGLDPSAFPSSARFCSWLTLCPNNRITGGRVKSSKTRKSSNRAADAFRLAAQSLARSHCALGAFYRRLRARRGAPIAITATAHKLARIFYSMWTNGMPYKDMGANYYEEKYKERVLRNLEKKAKSMGYKISLQPIKQEELAQVPA